ncbi:fungal-specific transcription factor domain-containing protein [Panaeolus papilionaceus]|nr:fungal-specific transcription factor domain-containing protein [Panaeolus papilionaceus]
MNNQDSTNSFMKGPKRKRLAKACDACHKSKRRCDGTGRQNVLALTLSSPELTNIFLISSSLFKLVGHFIILLHFFLILSSYYASKQCTYTDASGRPVPAPRPFKPERQDQQGPSREGLPYPPPPASQSSFRMYPNQGNLNDDSDDEHKHHRKRLRNERGNPMPIEDLVIDGPVSMERPNTIELEPALTRELTNLFFTHCHPARAVIHKPTFASALAHNRVPSHLLLAVCALAAPLSKQPRIKTTPSRFAGKPFAQEALSLMFDGAGRLVVEADLAAAQALCILQMHDILTKDTSAVWSSRFHDLALQIVEGLGVHSPEHPTLTPLPSPEFVQLSIEREAIRRIFWFIHVLDVMASIFFKKPVTFTDHELRLRLPVDETSFEMGVHSTLPEYLYLPAVRTQYASEFGHLIRVLSIYAKMEFALDALNGPDTNANPMGMLLEAEQKMEEWDRTLPDHLRFSEQSLQVQQSMFETSSNTGAWSWCFMHVYHASCALALNVARQRTHRGPKSDPAWALEKIQLILQMLGDRAKNSILTSLIKYCKRDDQQIRSWSAAYEDAWGTKVNELVQDWRSQPSPPQQHLYPSISHSQPPPSQPQHGHGHHNHTNQLSHRRHSDVRGTTSQVPFNINHPNAPSGSRPLSHQHGSDAPSHSPPMHYPLGRPPNSGSSSNNNTSNRNNILSPGSLTDSSNTASGNINNPARDTRPGPNSTISAASGSAVVVGPALGHGGNGNETSPSTQLGKYSTANGREANKQGNPQSRWSMMSGVSGESGAEGDVSLPSLRSSGLLGFGSSAPLRGEAQRSGLSGTSTTSSLQQQISPRRTTPPESSELPPPTSLAMPVGLPWLANESR